MRDADDGEFVAFVAAHEAEVARYLRRMVADRETARDLLQETLLAAFRAWPPAAATNLRGWLYRIATNQALAHFRRQRLIAWVSLTRLLAAGREPARSGDDERVEAELAIAAALAQLAPAERACLLLDAAGFASAEIAGHLGCSVSAARTRLCRAREAFRRHYRQHDRTEPEMKETGHAMP
jgi:RNA polymerase sigma-70 factor (ECF subfamily)